jgi:hypothetical protein
MRILTTFDNSQTVNDRSKQAREANSKPTTPKAQEAASAQEIKPERLSRNQILSRLEANKASKDIEQASKPKPVVLQRASWDDSDEDEKAAKVELASKAKSEAQKIEKPQIKESTDAESKAQEVVSDVGINDPSAPETRGKLQTLLSSGGFNFSEKEREALSQILK